MVAEPYIALVDNKLVDATVGTDIVALDKTAVGVTDLETWTEFSSSYL